MVAYQGGPPDCEFEAVIVAASKAAQGIRLLELARSDGGALDGYTPGAHIDLILANGLVRQYSLLPPDPVAGTWRIAVLRELDGRGGSAYVHDVVDAGSLVRIRGPRNNFQLEPAPAYLFIAGGIGITPLVGMVEHAEATGAAWRLAYAGRSRAHMAFLTELENAFPDRVETFALDVGDQMDVAAQIRGLSNGGLVYCCGPASLIAAVEAAAIPVDAVTVRVERFSPVVGEAHQPEADFEVELAATGLTLHVPAGRSLLAVLEDADVFVLSSCQEGTCGSCETRVLEGLVEHRDSLLTDEEKARNDTMLVCVSRARSPKLVLDL